jgi:hypothetical protein
MNTSSNDNPLAVIAGPLGKINSIELTRYAHHSVESFLKGLSPKSLKILCKESKRQPLDPEEFRRELLQEFRSGKDLPLPVLDKLKSRLGLHGIVTSFGEPFHKNAFPAWVRMFGLGPTELAFVLDGSRQAASILPMVRRLRPEQVPSLDPALDLISDSITKALLPLNLQYALKFLGFMGKFSPSLGVDTLEGAGEEVETKAPEQPKDSSAKAILQGYDQGRADGLAEVARLKSENEALGMLLQQTKAAHEEFISKLREHHQTEIQQLTRELSAVRQAQQLSEETLRQLNAQLAAIEASKDNDIAEGVEKELSALMRPWYAEARELEKLSADRAYSSLTERVHTVLNAQATFDTKHGSKTRLRNRLKQFERYACDIHNALVDSIKPSPALTPLLAEVELEVSRLRASLKEAEPVSPILGRIEDALHQANTEETLDVLADNIAALHNVGVFTHKEHLRLTKQQLKAYDRLRTRDELRPTTPQRRSGRELCLVLGNNRKATVYLDGNNVVHRDDRYAHLFDESGKVSEEVENALLQDVVAVASKCPAVTFCVVFDSHSPREEALTKNVSVRWSGGTGTNRADSAIVLHLAATLGGNNRFVITDDNSLRQETTRLGGVYVDVAIWGILLEHFVPEPFTPAAITGS